MSTLIVTSAEAGEGKTTITAGLAMHLLVGGRTVLCLRIQGADAAAAERDAAVLAAVPGIRSPGRPVSLSEAPAIVKEAGKDGAAIVEADQADASDAVAALGAGIVVVQRPNATEDATTLTAGASKAAAAVTAVAAADLSNTRASFEGKGVPALLVLPEDRTLAAPRLTEAAQALEASFICDGSDEDEVIERIMIGSVGHDPGSAYFSKHERKAVLTRFEKTDVQLAALGTPLVCLMLTGGQRPSPYLFDRAQSTGVPVLLTAHDTTAAMEALGAVFVEARFGGSHKLERLRELLAEHLDAAALESILS